MEIKTIATRIDCAHEFDAEVNEALKEGFVIKNRYTVRPNSMPNDGRMVYTMFVAELEKK